MTHAKKPCETSRFHSICHETYGYLCFLVHNLSESLLTEWKHSLKNKTGISRKLKSNPKPNNLIVYMRYISMRIVYCLLNGYLYCLYRLRADFCSVILVW